MRRLARLSLDWVAVELVTHTRFKSMKFSTIVSLASALIASAAISVSARAATLAEFTPGTDNGGSDFAKGQSFTVSGSGAYTDITFNFFLNGSPVAGGTGFLLSSAYSGTAAGLSSGTAGYLGSAVGAGGFYGFGSGVTLTAGVQYFLYSNAPFAVSGSGSGGYVGGALYDNGGSGGTFITYANQDWNFRVTGNPVSNTPDGGTSILMLGFGLGLLAVARRGLAS